jgi:hypothetical protein
VKCEQGVLSGEQKISGEAKEHAFFSTIIGQRDQVAYSQHLFSIGLRERAHFGICFQAVEVCLIFSDVRKDTTILGGVYRHHLPNGEGQQNHFVSSPLPSSRFLNFLALEINPW